MIILLLITNKNMQILKPKIAIDTSCMDRRPAKGTAIFTRELIKGLVKYRDQFDITLVHRQKIPEDQLYKEFKEIIIPKISLPKFSTFFSELLFFLRTKEYFDIYHFSHPRLLPSVFFVPAKKIVLMQYDGGINTSPIKLEDTKKKIGNFWWSIIMRRVSAFIVTSQFGVDGLAKQKGIDSNKVHLLYGGVDKIFKPLEDIYNARKYLKEKYHFESPFIVGSGRLDPHKNIIRLIQAYNILVKNYSVVTPLVITGGIHHPAYSDKVFNEINALGLNDLVKIIMVVDFNDMKLFYGAAEFMIFPSLYEGFGLPLAEAMATGVPTASSYSTSLIEVGGNATKFFDPLNVEEMAKTMLELLNDKRLREKLVERGFNQVKKFSWDNHVKGTVDLYNSLIK